MSPDELFTRDEVLGGLPARRAATLLFLVESRTAHLADQSRRAMDFFLSEEASKERDLAFLEAFSLGREPPVRVTIQVIERFAANWASLVPDNPNIRAAVAHLLGQKYKFTKRAAPGIRTAVALDGEAVRQAYRRLYRADLETIFAPQISWAGRLSWLWASLSRFVDSLSPFWLTFALTVAFSLSQAFLALPTGIAHVGPLAGVVLVVVIGLINVITMACMAEACSRNGDFRYGKAFIGRLVTDYLGSEASLVFSVLAAIRTFLVMLAGSIGIGLTLATFTHVPAEVWITLLLFIELYYLSRKSLNVTATTMVLLIALNVVLLLPIALLAFSHLRAANLFYASVPFHQGKPFDPSVLQLVFGVIVMLYIGHVYVIQCAKIVLPRDPSARSLIQGSVAGTAFLVLLFSLWVLAIGGALTPEELAGQAGTALTPLAERIGPSIHVLGSLLVVLLLGMSCLRTSTVLFNLTQEFIPIRWRSTVALPRRKGSLFLSKRGTPSGGPRLGVSYLGLTEGQPQFRIEVQLDGHVHRSEISVPKTWDAAALVDRLPELRPHGVNAVLEVLDADTRGVRVRITSAMNLGYEGEWSAPGLHVADVGTLGDSLRQLLNWMTRRGEVSLAEVTEHTGEKESIAQLMIQELIELGFVHPLKGANDSRYRIHLAGRRGRQVPPEIWQSLDETASEPPFSERILQKQGLRPMTQWVRGLMLSEGGRFFVCASPVLVVFFLAEALLLTGAASFAGVLGFGGVVANSLTAGIFPVLLLVSSRRKGDFIPAVIYRFLDHPLCATTVYFVFLANLFLHGLFIWQNPWARGVALVFGFLVIGITIVMFHRGAFSRRTVLELRGDSVEGGGAVFRIITGGQPLTADVQLGFSDGEETRHTASSEIPMLSKLRYATFHLPATSARELKVWAHRVTHEGGSEGLAGLLEVDHGNETKQFDLKLSGGQVILPLIGGGCSLRIVLPKGDSL
ncbi:MAG TPA: hypothetical protein VFU31_10360 [Candidatus Binatia bacterium]|nr:hypothetical protein [Candidatus Binatia bacterium]